MPDPLPDPAGIAWFVLELDTTAPQLNLGPPQGTTGGETLSIAYSASEQATVEAKLRSPNGMLVEMDVDDTTLSVPLPADIPGGNYRVIINAVDTVGNARGYDVTFTIDGQGVVLEPAGGGGFNPFTFTAGPLVGVPFELSLDGEVEGVRQVRLPIAGSLTGQGIRRTLFTLPGEVYAERMVTMSFEGERSRGERMATLAREDDLLLLGVLS